MQTARILLKTPLGELAITAQASMPGAGLVVHAGPFRPTLPPGMAVENCHAVVFTLTAGAESPDVVLKAEWSSPLPTSGHPETGQGLEAQVWEGAGHVLAIGTEDEEVLRARTGDCSLRAEVRYEACSFTLALSHLPPVHTIGLHLLVAWNPLPEPVECSCWHAVDQAQAVVAAQLVP